MSGHRQKLHGMISSMIHSLMHKHDLDITHEDTITSTIIGTLLHLPDQLLWKILREACYASSVLPKNPGKLGTYEFWPKWDAQGTENSNYVEPDVFLRFSNADLIIEAKRSDQGGQYSGEWEREMISYDNEYSSSKVPVVLISLGGNGSNTANETLRINGQERTIVKCSWVGLYDVLAEELENLAGNNLRIVESLMSACDQFGIRSYQWLDARPWVAKYVIEAPVDCHNLVFRRQLNG
jgi:hypothetical protein